MPDTTTATSKLTRFYGELSPSLETVKQALAFAGVDTEHPRARDLYVREHRLPQPRHAPDAAAAR